MAWLSGQMLHLTATLNTEVNLRTKKLILVLSLKKSIININSKAFRLEL
jgi:hypothetical protein